MSPDGMRAMLRRALCLLTAATSLGAAQTPGAAPPPIGRLVDVGGYRVHLYCTGTGGPATVIAGAGYSFDWDLVQSAASKDGRVCSYDPSGSAWSDTSPSPPTCESHIGELHRLLEAADIHGPIVLVGQSIGAVFARLYAARFPRDVAGMVIVDHAAVIRMTAPPVGPGGAAVLPPGVVLGRGVTLPPNTELPPGTATAGTADLAYRELPPRDRALHAWADSLPSSLSRRAQRAMFDRCVADADSIAAKRTRSLNDLPVVVISLPIRDAGYEGLQRRLLSLSSNSAQIIADSSGHLIHIDRPNVVVRAIAMVRTAVRDHSRLKVTH